jgi:AF2212-like
MTITIEATFDGEVLRLKRPPDLAPNTRVIVTIEPLEAQDSSPASFLQTAKSVNIEGPPDLAINVDAYLYGEAKDEV